MAVGAALAGCGGEARAPGGAHPSLDDLPRYTLVEELSIGSQDDPNVGFSRIAGIVVDGRGHVFVRETRDRHIRVYDSEGRRLRVIGGPGQGPGEFTFGGSGTWWGIIEDTLWVNERPRLTLLSLEGELLGTLPTASTAYEPAPGVSVNWNPGQYLGGGVFASSGSFGGSMSAITELSPRLPVVRMSASGSVRDTIRWNAFRGSSALRVTIRGVEATVPQEPDERPLYLDHHRGSVDVERPAATSPVDALITVTRRNSSGDTIYRRAFAYTPRPFTPEVMNRMMEVQLRLYTNRAGPDADTSLAAAAIRAVMPLPAFQPPVGAIRLADDDVLWIGREGVEPLYPSTEWILIGPAGEPVGRLKHEPTVTLHWSSGDTVWGVALDELEVPWLVRYRLVRVDDLGLPFQAGSNVRGEPRLHGAGVARRPGCRPAAPPPGSAPPCVRPVPIPTRASPA